MEGRDRLPTDPCPGLSWQVLVAYRRVQALQKLQPWPQVSLSTSSSQNSLAKTERATSGDYNDLDRKILQLCGKGGTARGILQLCMPSGHMGLEAPAGLMWPLHAHAGELYDLDAASLQLKVLNYVSATSFPLAPAFPVLCRAGVRTQVSWCSSPQSGPSPSYALLAPVQGLQVPSSATACPVTLVKSRSHSLSRASVSPPPAA